MVSTLCFSPVFLPSLGDPAEPGPAAATADDGIHLLYDELLAQPCFAALREDLEAIPSGEPLDEPTAPGHGHPVATILSDAPSEGLDIENTLLLPAVEPPTTEPRLPDVGGPAYARQHA